MFGPQSQQNSVQPALLNALPCYTLTRPFERSNIHYGLPQVYENVQPHLNLRCRQPFDTSAYLRWDREQLPLGRGADTRDTFANPAAQQMPSYYRDLPYSVQSAEIRAIDEPLEREMAGWHY